MPKTPNWREADQLVSSKRDPGVDRGLLRNIAGLVVGVTLWISSLAPKHKPHSAAAVLPPQDKDPVIPGCVLLTIEQYGMKLEPLGASPSFPSLLYTLTAPPGPPDPPVPGELVGVSPSSLAGRAATRGTDRMTPFPVPTQRRSLVSISDVIRTNENPNLPVPEKKQQIISNIIKIGRAHV